MPALSNNEAFYGYNYSWDVVPEDVRGTGSRVLLNVPDVDDAVVIWDAAVLVTQELTAAVGRECNSWVVTLSSNEGDALSVLEHSGFSVPLNKLAGANGAEFADDNDAYKPYRSSVEQTDTILLSVAGNLLVDTDASDFDDDGNTLFVWFANMDDPATGLLKTGDAVRIALTSDEEGDKLPDGLLADTTYYLKQVVLEDNSTYFEFYVDAALGNPADVQDAGQGDFRVTRAGGIGFWNNGRVKVLARIAEPLKYSK